MIGVAAAFILLTAAHAGIGLSLNASSDKNVRQHATVG